MALPRIGGSNVPLPNVGLASNFTAVGSAPFTDGYYTGLTNAVTLAAGETWVIPAGTWWIARGPYTFLQFLDPITNRFKNFVGDVGNPTPVASDGSNWRLANLTGCAIGASITAIGTASAATTGIGSSATGLTVTASSGGSTWTPIIGGAVSTTLSTSTGTTTAGAGYNYVPVCVIDAPPQGGLQATGIVTSLSSGTIPVAAIQVLNQGAGYITAPNVTFIPDPREATSTTPGPTSNAVVVLTLTATGTLTGLYPNNHGTPLTGVPTLSFSTGTGAATVIMNFCVTSFTLASTTAAGAGYFAGTQVISTQNVITAQTSPAPVNPLHVEGLTFPRPARITANIVAGVATTTGQIIEDGGLGIQVVPKSQVLGANTTGGATLQLGTPAVGGLSDTSYVQQF
jgi:hypothetical protein